MAGFKILGFKLGGVTSYYGASYVIIEWKQNIFLHLNININIYHQN